jgi:hypothetical protein
MFDAIRKQWKAVTAFLVPLIGLLTFVATDDKVVAAIGGTVPAWLLTVGIPALTYVLTFLKRNERSIDEAEAILARARERVSEGKQAA